MKDQVWCGEYYCVVSLPYRVTWALVARLDILLQIPDKVSHPGRQTANVQLRLIKIGRAHV